MEPNVAAFDEGVLAYRSGEMERAITCFRSYLTNEPQNWKCRFYLAMALTSAQKTKDAKSEFLLIRNNCPDPELRERASQAMSTIH